MRIQIKFTHSDKGNCRRYFTDDRKNIYCQYEGESDYYICSKDGEPSYKLKNIEEIKE
jgi:hypothetical protein